MTKKPTTSKSASSACQKRSDSRTATGLCFHTISQLSGLTVKYCSFKFKCKNPSCGTTIEMRSAFVENLKPPTLALEKCTNADCAAKPMLNLQYLQNCLANAIRSHVAKYYEGWMLCEDPRCGFRTKTVGNKVHKDKPVCRKCNQSVSIREVS
jgi:DNA polymerase alpha subunit A